MPQVVLATVNARYAHASAGLRCVGASLHDLEWRLEEFVGTEQPADIAERILSHDPKVIGLGVYIWNVVVTRNVVAILKTVRPDVVVVLGGPEVSHEPPDPEQHQPIVKLADHVISGEGEQAFRDLCGAILRGEPSPRFIAGGAPDLTTLPLPYDLYSDTDVAHRVIYVEASRGCPFKCQFCLSALDTAVRDVPLDRLLPALDRLLDRGVTQFKFVDRTFNLKINTSRQILEFFAERQRPGLFVHFELVPDRLPAALREVIQRFPPGALQFEVGLQTLNPEVGAKIQRRQNMDRVRDNLGWLGTSSGVHVHADLIVGLPGEDLDSFGEGFDALLAMGPQEIQVGILKRLRGAPIRQHDALMRYADGPPYEVLGTDKLSFGEIQRMKRFAKAWDVVANSGTFVESAPMLWQDKPSPFWGFLAFVDWLVAREGRVHSLSLDRLVCQVQDYLIDECGFSDELASATLLRDYTRSGRTKFPKRIRQGRTVSQAALPKRQQRHVGAPTPQPPGL